MSNSESLISIRTSTLFSEMEVTAAENAAASLELIIWSDPSAAKTLFTDGGFSKVLENPNADSKAVNALDLPDPDHTKPIVESLAVAILTLFDTTKNGQYADYAEEVFDLAKEPDMVTATKRFQDSHKGSLERVRARRALTIKYLGYVSLVAKNQSAPSSKTETQQKAS